MPKDDLIITGTMENGRPFRPSDWSERLSSTLASFLVDHRLRYSLAVQPCIVDGERCLVVARWLEDADPAAYAYVMGFAHDNRLRIQIDRRSGDRALRPL
ncbi:MAG: hypothetical protein BGO61_00950 [Thiobacillus sp. 65-69]|nr:DUF3579 domain-containing protein [Thiobacillus sp.]ODU88036.1 MAG: hypothetical protein ABT21_11595 [Thiobacillus sp. SCN 65-179]OJW36284.1 MAG: hypothetical protein BGO61_00950 [Thiobacillus sp. 65-69]